MLQLTQLCGFGAVASAKLTALTQVPSSVSIAATITIPASILAGDLIVLVDFAAAGSLPTLVTPSGFTNVIDNTTNAIRRIAVCWKIAVGTESSTILTGMNGTTNRKAAIVFRPDNPIASITTDDAVGQFEFTNSAPTNQVQSVAALPTPVVVLALWTASTGTIDPRGMSPAKDGEVAISGTAAYAGWKVYNSSPSDTTISQEDEGNGNAMWSGHFRAT